MLRLRASHARSSLVTALQQPVNHLALFGEEGAHPMAAASTNKTDVQCWRTNAPYALHRRGQRVVAGVPLGASSCHRTLDRVSYRCPTTYSF